MMGSLKRTMLLAALLTALPGHALAQTQKDIPIATEMPRMAKIVLVGDSTVAVQGGWGPSFCGYHVTSAVACVNLAKGGRSSGSYWAEKSWDVALQEMRLEGFAKTYVLVQFGHNDQPGKPGRSTDLATEFPVNLRKYVEEVRAAGAVPVLVTPLTRRQFRDGILQDDLGPWAEAARKVAREMGAPLIDLHARSRAAVQEMGPTKANLLAQMPPPPEVAAAALTGTTIPAQKPAVPGAPSSPPAQPAQQDNAKVEPMGQAKLSFDYTHLGRVGADLFATIVTEELATAVPELRRFLIP